MEKFIEAMTSAIDEIIEKVKKGEKINEYEKDMLYMIWKRGKEYEKRNSNNNTKSV